VLGSFLFLQAFFQGKGGVTLFELGLVGLRPGGVASPGGDFDSYRKLGKVN
jgi:hypothetical protein